MDIGKHRIWIRIDRSAILIKLTNKKIDNVFFILRGRSKKNKVSVRKRTSIRRALVKKALILKAYMSDFGGQEFLELMVSLDLYRKLKDDADQLVYNYENPEEEYIDYYDKEFMVF